MPQAYRQAARKWHPDVNQEEGAKEKFQQINEAYQILSDEQKRDTYDRCGASAMRSELNLHFVDPAVFFAVLFGSDAFEPYARANAIQNARDGAVLHSSSDQDAA